MAAAVSRLTPAAGVAAHPAGACVGLARFDHLRAQVAGARHASSASIAGLGALVFYEALVVATHLFLGVLAGYHVPTPVGEGGCRRPRRTSSGRGPFPLVVCAGALARGLARLPHRPRGRGPRHRRRHLGGPPQPAWHPAAHRRRQDRRLGPHHRLGRLRRAGRPDRADQRRLRLASGPRRSTSAAADARIAVASGIGSGIGAIFGAPLGGAVLATEILYRDDFEVEALLPAFIASIVGYVVFGSVRGFGPLFGYAGSYHFAQRPAADLVRPHRHRRRAHRARSTPRASTASPALFARLPVPRWSGRRSAALLVGCIGSGHPRGARHRLRLDPAGPRSQARSPSRCGSCSSCPFARIVATGLSIGSGGSGGIFGPGMVIGAFVGAAVWRLARTDRPQPRRHDPAPYVSSG